MTLPVREPRPDMTHQGKGNRALGAHHLHGTRRSRDEDEGDRPESVRLTERSRAPGGRQARGRGRRRARSAFTRPASHIGDWHLMTGPTLSDAHPWASGSAAPKARVRGTDVAGVVEAVGKNVTRLQAGDEVFGVCRRFLRRVLMCPRDEDRAQAGQPSFEQAAAVPTSACTALQALRDSGGIQPGQKVMIVGASGGRRDVRCADREGFRALR